MEQKCNWCGFEVDSVHPFCMGCGVSQQNALKVRPYVKRGMDLDDVVIDPTDGRLLQRDSQWVNVANPDGREVAVKINPKNINKLKKNGYEFYLKILGFDRQGLVLLSFSSIEEVWIPSFCFGYAFFHQDLFGTPPQIGSATRSRIILNPANHWKCNF